MVVRNRDRKEGGKEDCVKRYLVSGRATREGNAWLPAFVLVKEDCESGYSIEGVSVIREGGEEEVLKGEVRKIYMNGEYETGRFDLLFEMRDNAKRYTVIVKFRKWKPKTASIVFD